ncbi:IS110 family transposase [Pedobacter sp. Leaf194]|uniref:IS110 family transposase n=1 Tax=Pedobacter sp. Leaf194 TaxID=1736297 RepID=UPI000703A61E|nr:IS110 family transposase [Pedobacter sp. Leaf194]KQS41754.1 hypothetical protein ASG14_04705 [Pedobacter sp. Leaf194]
MGTELTRKFKFYIGIDVSKSFFDYVITQGKTVLHHKQVLNKDSEIESLILDLKQIAGFKLSNAVFGMEHSGLYCNALLHALHKKKAKIVHENANMIRNSLGNLRGKTDKIDAGRIAEYLYKCREGLKFWEPKRQILNQLASLASLRERLIATKNILDMPLKEMSKFATKEIIEQTRHHCQASLLALNLNIADIDNSIKLIWSGDEYLSVKMKQMMSVPYVGKTTALQILIKTNELIDINDPRKFAAFCGVAPYPHKSGTTVNKRTRTSSMADKKMKALIHICALGSIKTKGEFRTYYDRKTVGEGKNGMLVLNAIRFKLLLRIFACVNGNRMYQAEYIPTPKRIISQFSLLNVDVLQMKHVFCFNTKRVFSS